MAVARIAKSSQLKNPWWVHWSELGKGLQLAQVALAFPIVPTQLRCLRCKTSQHSILILVKIINVRCGAHLVLCAAQSTIRFSQANILIWLIAIDCNWHSGYYAFDSTPITIPLKYWTKSTDTRHIKCPQCSICHPCSDLVLLHDLWAQIMLILLWLVQPWFLWSCAMPLNSCPFHSSRRPLGSLLLFWSKCRYVSRHDLSCRFDNIQLLKNMWSNTQSFKGLGEQACSMVFEVVLAMTPYSGQDFPPDLMANLKALTGYEVLAAIQWWLNIYLQNSLRHRQLCAEANLT